MLLAACGGGSGGNLTTASETESEPPVTGSPLALSSSEGDGQQQPESDGDGDGDGEQGKNVQPENDQESEEAENNNNEEAPQQLTIIEEEDFPYVPPEEEEPRYSAQTQTQTQTSSLPAPDPTVIDSSFNCMTNYVLDDCTPNVGPRSSSFTGTTINYNLENSAWAPGTFTNLKGKDRGLKASSVARNVAFDPTRNNYNFDYNNINRLKKVEVTYSKTNGFEGFYTYKGTAYGSSTATQKDDVTLKATFYNEEVDPPFTIEGSIGGSDGLTIGSTNFGNITFTAQGNRSGQFTGTNISFSNSNIRTEAGFNEVKGSFKNDGSSSNFPSQVVGELKMKRFFDQSPDKSSDEYRNNLYLRGENAIAGVFLADRGNEVVKENLPPGQTTTSQSIADPAKITLEGSFPAGRTGGGAFPYGLWANENFMKENRTYFLELTGFLNPTTRPGIYTSHQTLTGSISYKREDGFKGIYIYEGETGELTGDVDLVVSFSQPASSDQGIGVNGNISTELEIEENDLNGIVLAFGQIDASTGVGGLSPGLLAAKLAFVKFGETDITANETDLATMHDQGQAKIRMVLSPDGRHARGGGASAQPENYPSYIAGEVEINGFKINAEDGDHNTMVGVFIGDKQEQ